MPDVDFKKLQSDTMEAVNAIREKADKFGVDSADFKEAQERADAKMTEFDTANQKLVSDIAAERKARGDMGEKVSGMEKELLSFGAGNGQKKGDYKKTPAYKALNAFAMNDITGISQEQKSLLRTDVNGQGGYLTIPEMNNEILKKITEISPIRQFARVKSVGSRSLFIPVRNTIPTAAYEGEAELSADSNSTYTGETLTTWALTANVGFTREQLLDKHFDIESEISQDVTEAFAFAEGRTMVAIGDGSKKPQAILQDSRLTDDPRVTAESGLLDMDSMRLLTGDLKVGYNPIYFFNRRTKATLLVEKGSDGHYLWSMASDAAPAILSGYNYSLFEDMPDIAASALPVGFGDLMRGYCITDFTGMEMIRDEFTRKKERIIELSFTRWNTGQVVLPEAIKLLKIKA